MKERGQTRRSFLSKSALGLTGLALARASAGRGPSRPPNVILIMTDDQGYGDLSCTGNPILRTPNMDKLYRESVRLENFHVSPTCSPTRAALMTGHYSNRTGVWHTIMGRSILLRDEITAGQIFAANGYRTGVFGKWHLGDNYPSRPQDRGFQETLVHGGGGVGQTPDYWGNDYFDDTYFKNGVPHKCRGYCTDVFFKAALRFIEENRNRPFFCYLPTNAPHGPYRVPEKYAEPYKKPGVPNPNFYGMIANIDWNLGKLLTRLQELGLYENTIVIFMTDNGTAAGFRGGRGREPVGYNAGMRGTKGSQYDGGHRVPCFIRWPAGGLLGGRAVKHITAHVDILPTLIDLCGLKPPADIKFDGVSLRPLLQNPDCKWPDRILVVDSQRIEYPEKWRKSAVMSDRWRLIDGKELYDMTVDPGQRHDVAGRYPDVVKRLREAYEKWWADISPRFDLYARIALGDPAENPSRLTCHDWHGRRVPWHQGAIRRGLVANGFWAVEISRPGTYEFALRWFPREEDKVIEAKEARLKIGSFEASKQIEKGAVEVTFRVPLKPGKAKLQTWFIEANGRSRGAYFVYVKRL